MSVYKITCESGLVYYGATKNDIFFRKSKGHKYTRCKNFKNPKIELVETVEDISKLFEREKYYIQNNDCVNLSNSIVDKKKRDAERMKQRRRENPEREKAIQAKTRTPIECSICGAMTSKKHIKRHQQSKKCLSLKT